MPRILVIDDDNVLRSVLRVALETAGHHVLEATDGAEGIKLFRQQPADLVFCDLVMPGKEGVETIQELRCHFASVRIVAMSGGAYGGRMDCLPVAKKLGAAAVLKKPFDLKALSAVVEGVLSGSGGGDDDRQDAVCG